MREIVRDALLVLVSALSVSCSPQRKLAGISRDGLAADISLPAAWQSPAAVDDTVAAPVRDTLKVTGLDGREVLIMKAVRDESTGEMVATEQLDAAVVSARFRNVAERHGKVALEFQVRVPEDMHDSKWQIRLHPDMFILGDSLRLDDVVITGADYRNAQLRGYEHYRRFVSRIVTDSLKFVHIHELEVFLERNLPAVYAMRNDSSYVSDDSFASLFGVTEHEAVEHYTNMLALKWNERRKNNMDRMWRRYVKAPLVTEGIRLDTVIRDLNGDFLYNYVQEVATRPKLRKVEIRLGGGIFEQDRQIYSIPVSDPLSFYISSISAFADESGRLITKVISRDLAVARSAGIDFRLGSSVIDEALGDNAREIAGIKRTLDELVSNPDFVLDSVTVSAWASPEGTAKANDRLSSSRAASASSYFSRYLRSVSDSVNAVKGYFVEFDSGKGEGLMHGAAPAGIEFLSRRGGENWQLLDGLVAADTLLTDADRNEYFHIGSENDDPDVRERMLSRTKTYGYIRENLYPRLRNVIFQFYLHRAGMQKDTVQTTVVDSVYMAGVQAVKDRDYRKALELLAPYQDFNTAIAFVALDRNLSALAILEGCPASPRSDYLLAIVHARLGDETKAVEHYLRACEADRSLVFRGNLDPEISSLVIKYDLNSKFDGQ